MTYKLFPAYCILRCQNCTGSRLQKLEFKFWKMITTIKRALQSGSGKKLSQNQIIKNNITSALIRARCTMFITFCFSFIFGNFSFILCIFEKLLEPMRTRRKYFLPPINWTHFRPELIILAPVQDVERFLQTQVASTISKCAIMTLVHKAFN